MSRSKKSASSSTRVLQSPDLSAAKSIEDVVSQLGPSTTEEVLALLGPVDPALLVAEGVQHATARIVSDVFRVVTFAHRWFSDPAVADETRSTVRMSPDLLRVLAWAAAHDASLAAALPRRAHGRETSASRDLSAGGLAAARALREQLADTLARVAPSGSELALEVNAARRPGDPLALDRSLRSLVTLGQALLSSRDPGVIARAKAWKLDLAWLHACEAVAKDAAARLRDLKRPGDLAVTQKELDHWDGVVLRLLADVVGAFNRANAVNPLVPRVAYVSLRARTARRDREQTPAPAPADPVEKPAE